jgi:lysophospholipid hydrolase
MSSQQVFHELARHLQTRRLIAGDSLSLDQDKSFYCVVDGVVQVFTQTGQSTESHSGSWDEEGTNGYQLLNEVRSGGTLSSLFTILSLFTEEVKMSWQDDSGHSRATSPDNNIDGATVFPTNRPQRTNSDVSQYDLPSPRNHNHIRRPSVSSSSSTVHAEATSLRVDARSPSHSRYEDSFDSHRLPQSSVHRKDVVGPPKQVHQSVIARAAEDATLAVIPAEAFRRLTKKFPKATGHIVQGTKPC